MKRKLIITTFGIFSLGINSVLAESVHSQWVVNGVLYNCYLESNERVVGQVTVLSYQIPEAVCNTDIILCQSDPDGCDASPWQLEIKIPHR